jgi:thiamine biosynthesis protein ThiS
MGLRIEILINGEKHGIPAGLTVAGLLAHLGLEPKRLAVELNRSIVPRARWAETAVEADAQVEIVEFVGGGRL